MNVTQELPRFEIGLVSAGAISAGAYTAGVLDFLIEALDAWEEAKGKTPYAVPQHTAAIKVMSGASAGSIAGAITASILKYDFPHIRLGDQENGAQNPLYDSWVNMIDISGLLGTTDLKSKKVPVSLLDSTPLLTIAQKAINYGDGVNPKDRPYLCNPLRFIFTLTNLRGVPYSYNLQGNGPYDQTMTMHGDCLRFALHGIGNIPARGLQGDEYPLAYPSSASTKWEKQWGNPFAIAALASGAFPIGLAPRFLTRRTSDYDYIRVVVPGENGRPEVLSIVPNWTPTINPHPGDNYDFMNVDGGTIDNEPVDLARIELAGGDPLARNPRDGISAARAILMIDPFTGADPAGPKTPEDINLLNGGFKLLGALVDQARFKPEDIALANDDTVYSRFMIAPTRGDDAEASSGKAIACGSLGGFGGFLAKPFREHDFFLGRRNCQQFLAKHFSLPENNPLFARWTAEQKNRYRITKMRDGATVSELPIIPLVDRLDPYHPQGSSEATPPWPFRACIPASLRDPIEERLDGLYDALVTEWKGLLLKLGWSFFLKPKLLDYALGKIWSGLHDHKLI